ncbi:putative metal ion transporter [Francisella tularensis subsp. holarctica]|uniref:Metal ion transporter n=1 Tax=Francisella tularensis subsp. holarctica (strain LVS) TaxID=376619 RepID=A0AAI8BGQ6_FRATH|nr:putative metal ion transporter [Francisella tularensis subsp. holarctica]AJI58809.1 putative metal ion transporter [Francisella tularensis subsp. holarctica LVS]AJI65603.1 putative metal ion transporter [Francisella tularensis subsp. holarctica]AJI67166.1 putative metal ion transporter [Francisella tularensis subsp. holarctica]
MVEFAHLHAIDAMRPIKEMVSIDYNLTNREKLAVIKEFLKVPSLSKRQK